MKEDKPGKNSVDQKIQFVFEVDFDSGEEERLREEVMGEKVFNN